MSATLSGHLSGHDDPLYQEGMTHLQNGEWDQAIRCFQDLKRLYPDNERVQWALEESHFRAGLDTQMKVKPRRWTTPWGRYLLRAAIIILLVMVVVQGIVFIQRNLAPVLIQTQNERQMQSLLIEGQDYLDGGDLDNAEVAFNQLLSLEPKNEKAQQGLADVAEQRRLDALYEEAVRFQNAGEYDKALKTLMDFVVQTPNNRDAVQRIDAIRRTQDTSGLFAQAEAAYQAGDQMEAITSFELLRSNSANFKQAVVSERLFELYLQQGYASLAQAGVSTDELPQALQYFTNALAEKPRDINANQEQRLAQQFLDGHDEIKGGRWHTAVLALNTVYDQRPDYLNGRVPTMLYEALTNSGDRYKGEGDLPLAFEQYRRACELPVEDVTLCKGRMAEVVPFLTPTATPSPTPTVTPLPTVTPIPTATPILPTPTPVPLSQMKGKIIFYSQHPDNPGLWMMDPSGQNRRFYTNAAHIKEQYEEMFDQYRYSPDGSYRAYVTKGDGDKDPQVYIQGQVNDFGIAPTWKVSEGFDKVAYDPMWSPDGSRIVFVSQERSSDDIWVADVDGSNPRNLTPNDWEWEKHPSWSRDGRRIVFWSNRTGDRNIFVMDADGRNVKNLSNSPWDEWKPLWIR